jgi:DNA mismatch repair protein MutL
LELQELIHPITLSLTKEQAAFLEANSDQLIKVGINIEPFGGSTFIVRMMPIVMGLSKTEDDLRAFIDEMRADIVKVKDVNERLDLIIKTMACHSVVRSGEAVSLIKIKQILTELSKCKQPFTCPHGRPTIIRITQKNLEKEFGRIV